VKLSRPVLIVSAIAPVALFAALAIALGFGLNNDPATLPSVLIGKPAPAFALGPVRPNDTGFASADIAGKVALINVFGSWCSACRLEHPMLMDLASKGVAINGIDWKDSPADGAAWLQQFGDPYARVGNDQSGRLALDLGVSGAPETFIVDKRGRIRYKLIGPITDEVWAGEMAPLVARLEAEP
jgi:cytochrome c biogenesis protein CcmG/thiol:disulfide interchange protein DsbE